MGRHWPLFLPILLSLAEDHNTRVRIKGLHIIGLFLDTCPANTILSAGIDNVIQEAVFPTLLFLPSTTPESESIELLYPAYRVLLRIAQLDPDPKSLRRRRLLDKLLRDGVFAGHFHASQNARIVVVLMNVTKDIISCLGLYSAKHLQVNSKASIGSLHNRVLTVFATESSSFVFHYTIRPLCHGIPTASLCHYGGFGCDVDKLLAKILLAWIYRPSDSHNFTVLAQPQDFRAVNRRKGPSFDTSSSYIDHPAVSLESTGLSAT